MSQFAFALPAPADVKYVDMLPRPKSKTCPSAARECQKKRQSGANRLPKNQAAHTGGVAQRELLGEPASPGDAQHIGLLVAELIEKIAQQRRRGPQVVGDDRLGGPAYARQIKPDHCPLRIECVNERLQHLKARPDTVAQHERWPSRAPVAHRDLQDPARQG
ncbi:MAG: hypothetical protein ABR926_11075 [Streptosporangiaceae bacterium]